MNIPTKSAIATSVVDQITAVKVLDVLALFKNNVTSFQQYGYAATCSIKVFFFAPLPF